MASTSSTTTDRGAAAAALDAAADGQLLTFRVGAQRYGCRLEAVREIFAARPATRLPGAPPHVLGLVNVRGALLTVLDVGRWLHGAASGEATAGGPSGHVLVVEADGRQAGCRVDGLGRALPLPPLEAPPAGAAGNGTMGGIVLGIGEADGELVAVLDLPALVRQSLLFPGER